MSYEPDPDFIHQLAELLPKIPRAGLVDLYYDIWHCVPSNLAFRIATRNFHDPERLSHFLTLAERVLTDAAASEAFAQEINDDAESYEAIAWLQRRVKQ